MKGEGIESPETGNKKRPASEYSVIPVFGTPGDRIITFGNRNIVNPGITPVSFSKDDGQVDPSEQTVDEFDEFDENTESPRYNYIGYSQDYSIDDSQSYVSIAVLKKMAKDAIKAKNYFTAMQFLNKILIRDPSNKEALFYKKKLLILIREHKQKMI